jgi:hypothetical protein
MSGVLAARDHTLDDGLGVRAIECDPIIGTVDVLDVTEVLADAPVIDEAVRTCAARYAAIDPALIVPVRRIRREGGALRISFAVAEGRRLCDLLADLEAGRQTITDAGVLQLAASVVRTVASLHQLLGLIAHGAITPSHVVIRHDGTAVLTDAVFGSGIEALHWTRAELWREFGIAMPAATSLHRFDQRADVTQLAAVVLAIALRRRIRRDEYPDALDDLVVRATPLDGAVHMSALRMWLRQALRLHPRSVLGTGVDALQMFAQVMAAAR